MSIFLENYKLFERENKELLFELNEKNQKLNVTNEEKSMLGIVHTPFQFILNMLNIIPEQNFKIKKNKWLDPACGYGYFGKVLFNLLMFSLKNQFKSREKQAKHIIENMMYMIDIQFNFIEITKKSFIEKYKNIIQYEERNKEYLNKENIIQKKVNELHLNIYCIDFLSLKNIKNCINNQKYDFIIGNPPYNMNGLKKVPTNNHISKKNDGKTIWTLFIKESVLLLKEKGKLLMIVPSIWMKPDKLKIYNYMLQYKTSKIHCFSNHKTKNIFKGQAQTPTCYFILNNDKDNDLVLSSINKKQVDLYDFILNKYVSFSFFMERNIAIPLNYPYFIQKMFNATNQIGKIQNIYKTNCPSKSFLFSLTKNINIYPYQNIKTCLLEKDYLLDNNINNNIKKPKLSFNFSDKPCNYYGEKKIILAHKMFGIPFFDISGIYGISNRDNYVILAKNYYSNLDLLILQKYLSHFIILMCFDSFRYRMSYLEKYVFDFIPDITKLFNNEERKKKFLNLSLDEITYFLLNDVLHFDYNEPYFNIYNSVLIHQKKYWNNKFYNSFVNNFYK